MTYDERKALVNSYLGKKVTAKIDRHMGYVHKKDKYSQNEIAQAVNFQEQYYKTKVESLYQKSCGAIVYRKINNKIEYLLLFQKMSQTWSFPKGYMEFGETEEQTAK